MARRTVETRSDRLPPHSMEAEQGVLGCILLDPQQCISACVERIHCGMDAFYDLRNRDIYRAILDLYESGNSVDIITLQQHLKDGKKLDAVGGLAYLSSLPDSVPSAANLGHYVGILNEKASLRRLIATCTDYIARAFEHNGDPVGLLIEEFERDALAVRLIQRGGSTFQQLLVRAAEKVEKAASIRGVLGVPTGFPDIDDRTDGLHSGEMVVIAARPSQGKTALAMNVAENVAKSGVPVGVFSLEMSDESLALRMLLSRAKTTLRSLRKMSDTEKDETGYAIATAYGSLSHLPIHIEDCPGASMGKIRAIARRLKQRHNIGLVVIDYLQIVAPTHRRDSMREQVTETSNAIKQLARELNLPVIVLSQLNRDVEQRKGKPRLSDLRESGAIEQDADAVWMLHYPDEDEYEPARKCELLIAKQRNGPVAKVDLVFMKRWTRFESAAKVEDNDVPRKED